MIWKYLNFEKNWPANLFHNPNWDYQRMCSMSIDSYTRFFQYKISDNCLFLNRDLLLQHYRVSQLFILSHTFINNRPFLFIYCEHSRCLYRDIGIKWTRFTEIMLPQLNVRTFLPGVDAEKHSTTINLVLAAYKLLLYKSRSSGQVAYNLSPTTSVIMKKLNIKLLVSAWH